MISLAGDVRILVFPGATDMRNSVNGLASEHFSVDLLSGHLFLFCNRKRDPAKILPWHRGGQAFSSKRPEARTFSLSALKTVRAAIEVDATQLPLLLTEINFASACCRKQCRIA